jgi:hypothetical protein
MALTVHATDLSLPSLWGAHPFLMEESVEPILVSPEGSRSRIPRPQSDEPLDFY